MGLIILVALITVVKIAASNYIKVPPNEVAVFYGRKRQTADGKPVGFRVVTGGAKLKIPFLEDVQYLSLNVFSVDLQVKGAPNKDGVLVSVKSVANVKILSDEASLMAACERFLGMQNEQIHDIAYKNLEGHLRAIVGTLTVEEIVNDRTLFNQKVLSEAATDLKKIGLGIEVLTIQEIDDDSGYIKVLGQKRTAEVVRDATVGKAVADKDSRMKATDAQREAEQTAKGNEAQIAEAEKTRDVKKASYFAEIEQAKATATQAGPLAEAKAKQEVTQQQVEIERVRKTKETEVATAEAERKEKELLATVVKPAEAAKLAVIADAEGKKQSEILKAEAEKQKKQLEGEGEAAAILAKGTANAESLRLMLTAEAEGVQKKAAAYKELNEAGQFLQILEALQKLIPNALEKLGPVMAEIAKPLSNIESVKIVDFGGSNTGNGGAVGKFSQLGPQMLAGLIESLKAVGIDPTDLLKVAKLKEDGSAPKIEEQKPAPSPKPEAKKQ